MSVVKDREVGRVMLAGFRCERCTHTWVPRSSNTPTVCPKCKSAYWNKPKQDKSKAKTKGRRSRAEA